MVPYCNDFWNLQFDWSRLKEFWYKYGSFLAFLHSSGWSKEISSLWSSEKVFQGEVFYQPSLLNFFIWKSWEWLHLFVCRLTLDLLGVLKLTYLCYNLSKVKLFVLFYYRMNSGSYIAVLVLLIVTIVVSTPASEYNYICIVCIV